VNALRSSILVPILTSYPSGVPGIMFLISRLSVSSNSPLSHETVQYSTIKPDGCDRELQRKSHVRGRATKKKPRSDLTFLPDSHNRITHRNRKCTHAHLQRHIFIALFIAYNKLTKQSVSGEGGTHCGARCRGHCTTEGIRVKTRCILDMFPETHLVH
jgi:hypothetical protein